MEKARLTNVLLLVTIVLLVVVLWMLHGQSKNIEAFMNQQQTSLSTTQTPAILAEIPQAIATSATYIVSKGDQLSCVAPNNWKGVEQLNNIKNPDLIFPGQKLKLPPGTEVRGGCAAKSVQFTTYCRIGADPVNPNRNLIEGEFEYRLTEDAQVLMGTGSGKVVKCTLRAGETVVTKDFPIPNGEIERVATWVRKCGNPILSKLVVATTKPIQPREQEKMSHEKPAIQKPKGGLIILKTFEGAGYTESTETNGGILRNSSGSVVIDSTGNPIKTEEK